MSVILIWGFWAPDARAAMAVGRADEVGVVSPIRIPHLLDLHPVPLHFGLIYRADDLQNSIGLIRPAAMFKQATYRVEILRVVTFSSFCGTDVE
eukprot:1596900-Pyramimonas_sp.AAC.1